MRYFLFLSILVFSSSVFAQEQTTLLFRAGIGTYSMKVQKQFQKDFKSSSTLPLVIVHSFPAYPTFGGSLSFRVSPVISIGVWAEYASTGGRLHYKDYSGYVLMDQVLTCFQGGLFAQYHVNKSNTWPLYLTLHGSVVGTKEKLTSEIEVNGQFDGEEYKLEAINYGLRPGLMISRSINIFIFQFGLGVELQTHKDLRGVDDKNILFKTSDGDNLVAQWDGFRCTLGVGFKL